MSKRAHRSRKLQSRITRKAFSVPGFYRRTHSYCRSKGKTRAILKRDLDRQAQEMGP